MIETVKRNKYKVFFFSLLISSIVTCMKVHKFQKDISTVTEYGNTIIDDLQETLYD